MEVLLAHGYDYQPLPYDANNLGPRPAHLQDVPAFLQEQEQAAVERWRQEQIRRRAVALQAKRKKKRKQLEAKRHSKLAAE